MNASELDAARLPIGIPRRFSMASLLFALLALIIATPFLEDLRDGDMIQTALLTLVYLAAFWSMSARRRTFLWAIILIIPAIVTKWVDHLRPGLLPPALYFVFGLLCMGLVIIELLRFILRARHVDSDVMFASVGGYLMLVILWAVAYDYLAQMSPNAFAFNPSNADSRMQGFTSLYFSLGVMSTVGFGDITPVSRTARLLAVLEATTGVFYVAILISRLVGLYAPTRPGSDIGA